MRSGFSCVQQALTIEATNILKLSLNLARRRGHAQVTPLHVATTLLTSSSSSCNLLRRACLKSQPFNISSHPLQTRALELCFNVALNRLPTIPVPNSCGSLIHTQPSLSNALIAALKRAQAHQRRGCIEQQQQHFQQNHQQQSLLAIKVELEQLIISILDDPSVSRVMREAGFSSTSIKINLEEDSSSASAFFFDSNRDVVSNATFFNTHFLKSSPEQNPCPHFSNNEDLKVVYEILLRKYGRKNNVVVVGDSVTLSEGLVSEFVMRLEKGEVPNELKLSNFIKLHLSHVHLKLMSKIDVDVKVCDLRRKVMSLASEKRNNGGIIIFAGDLKWALDDENRVGFNPFDYLIKEVGNLITELRIISNCKVWLMATANYKTYMSCQMRHPSFESEWGLQAVVVPSGGLKLSLQQNQSEVDPRTTKQATHHPLQMLESKNLNPKEKEDEEDKLICCTECKSNFEKEASVFNTELTQLPSWLQPHKLNNHNKDTLCELRMKWNKLCQNFHGYRYSSNSWWSTLMADSNRKNSNTNLNCNNKKAWTSNVKTELSLGNPTFSDTATSTDQRSSSKMNQKELNKKLHENIPWQSEKIPVIVEALVNGESSNGSWLLLQGTDCIGKSRLARILADTIFGSSDKLKCIDARKSTCAVEAFVEAMRKDTKCLILIKDVDKASIEFLKTISECIKTGILEDEFGQKIELSSCVFILTASDLSSSNEDDEKVLKMKLCVEEKRSENHKRKNSVSDSTSMKKAKFELDLNISAEDSDLTQEIDGNNEVHVLSKWLVKTTVTCVTINKVEDGSCQMEENIIAKLNTLMDRGLVVDGTAIEGLKEAMGGYLESEFEKWLAEVFELSVVMVKNGGKVKLCVEGKEGNVAEFGFMGSVLPKRIHVD